MKKFKTVDEYISSLSSWVEEVKLLREIIHSSGLQETIKWGGPCYTFEGKNVVGLAAFKSYAGIWFFQGALLKDTHNVLINAQEGKTKGLRQWRFDSVDRIQQPIILQYINQAIENIQLEKKIKPTVKKEFTIPDELKSSLTKDKKLFVKWSSLSHSCQREYAEYINEAKKPETRQRRLLKSTLMIMDSKGLNDAYK